MRGRQDRATRAVTRHAVRATSLRRTSQFIANLRGTSLALTMVKCHAKTGHVERASRHRRGTGETSGRRLSVRAGGRPGRSNEPAGCQHGVVVARLMFLLIRHLQGSEQGSVMTEVGFKLASKPDTVRAPDVAFVRTDRLPSPAPRGFFHGPPDIAFEVLSPDDWPADLSDQGRGGLVARRAARRRCRP